MVLRHRLIPHSSTTMIRLNCLFVLASVFQVITSQGPPRFGGPPGRGPPPGFENIPEKCRGPPQGVENPEQCCLFDAIITEDDLITCGFKKVGEEGFQQPRGPPDCTKPICLLKQKGFLDDNDQINYPAMAEYLDGWSDDSFRPAVEMAKAICLQGQVPGPEHVCEHARVIHCVVGVMFGNCPQDKWQQTENCAALKSHMEECKPKDPFK